MSNFRHRLREATQILATCETDVKNRLGPAVTNHLLFANIPDDCTIPVYFRGKLGEILNELSTKTWVPGVEGDRVRATIHPMRLKTASGFAARIWNLYNEFEEFEHSGFIPAESS
jgi:hypothetical protein